MLVHRFVILLCSLMTGFAASAQSSNQTQIVELYGNEEQPGYVIQSEIKGKVIAGSALYAACQQVMTTALSVDSGLLGPLALDVVNQRQQLSLKLVHNIALVTQLPEAVKLSIENSPSEAQDIVQIATVLYPDSAQAIMNAAFLTGHISAEDALVAALSAGADPASVSLATAAGVDTTVGTPLAPLGVGIGSGGAGGGDTTASSN